MIVLRFTLTILFSTPLLALSYTTHYKYYNTNKDTVPNQYYLISNKDTLIQSNNFQQFKRNSDKFLSSYWERGYALARCELQEGLNNMDKINYVFIQGKKISKGKIIGWNGQYMDEALAPLVLNWKKGQLFTSQPFNFELAKICGIVVNNSELFFVDSIADLRMSMVPSRNQFFDGLMGIQQIGGKSVLIGDFKMNWLNAFKKGESLYLRWQRQDLATQRLEVNASIPFLFHRNFGWSNYFDFYRKKDLVFQIQLQSQLTIHMQHAQTWSSGVELKNNQSLVNKDPFYSRHQLWVNTWKQRSNKIEFAAGKRKSEHMIDNTPIKETSQLYRWEVQLSEIWNKKSLTLKTIFHSMGYSTASLSSAEQLRIGGSKNIRGFNVESIFVNQWHGFQTEWGYTLTNLIGYLFADGGFSGDLKFNRYHQSYGLGSRLNRKDFILTLEYGWGMFPGQPIDFRQGILHIGFNQGI